jgi:deoxyribonuclease-4
MLNIGYSITSTTKNYNYKKYNTIQFMFINIKKDVKYLKNIFKTYKNLHNIFIHSSFKINIAHEIINTNCPYNNSIKLFNDEIDAMKQLNLKNIVLHCGSKTIYSESHSLNNITKFINYALQQNMNIFLETMCKKSEMLIDLQDYVNFILSFKNNQNYNRLFSCIDTCHIFQAGYDINDTKIIKKVHNILSPIKDKIKLIHLNNSKYPCKNYKDVHSNLNDGYINLDNLIKFSIKYKKKCCYILENTTDLDKINI